MFGRQVFIFWNICNAVLVGSLSEEFSKAVDQTTQPNDTLSEMSTNYTENGEEIHENPLLRSKLFTGRTSKSNPSQKESAADDRKGLVSLVPLQKQVTMMNDRLNALEELVHLVNRTLWEEINRHISRETKPDNRKNYDVPVDSNITDSEDDDFQVVCSFPSWAFYRYSPEDIGAELCTDVVYGYAILDPVTLSMVPKDSSSEDLYQRVVALKARNPRLRIHLSLGGWDDSSGDKYSRLVSNPDARFRFISRAVSYLKDHKFDGLDLAWMFPVCWQANCKTGPPQDKKNFADFVRELRYAFNRVNPRLYLSATVAGGRDIINRAYQMQKMIGALDRVYLMSYDLAGPWTGRTGHHAPLYTAANGESPKWSVNDAVQHLLRKGVPPNKLVLGIPAYGMGFTLQSSTDHRIGARVTGPSTDSETYGDEGRFTFYEICDRVKNFGWTKISDPSTGPYAYKDTQWVSYDDVESAAAKAKYVKLNQLGGAAIWDVSVDDFGATCCDVKNPILNAVSYTLNGRGKSPSDLGCEPRGISPEQTLDARKSKES